DSSNTPPIPNLGATTRSTTSTRAPAPAPHRRRAAPKPVRFRLYVSASHGNCWMDVRNWSQNGGARYTGTLELGQAKLFRARRLWINFGAPSNLSIALNGKAVAVPAGGFYLVTPKGIVRAAAAA